MNQSAATRLKLVKRERADESDSSREQFVQQIRDFLRTASALEVAAIQNSALDRKAQLLKAGVKVPGKVSYSQKGAGSSRAWSVQWSESGPDGEREVKARYVGKRLPPYDAFTCLQKILNDEPLFE